MQQMRLSRPSFSRQQFGGSIGGPIKANKAFFFGTVERTRERGNSIVPGVDQAKITFLEPFGYDAVRFLPQPFNDWQYTIKGDFNLNSKHTLVTRFAGQNNDALNDQAGFLIVRTDLSGGNESLNTLYNFLGSLTSTFTSNTVNQLTYQYQTFDNRINATTDLDLLFFPDGLALGRNGNVPQQTIQKKHQFRDDLTWNRGNHGWKFGGDVTFVPTLGGLFAFNSAPEYDFQFNADEIALPQRKDIQLRPVRGKPSIPRTGVVNAFSQDVPKAAREKFERAQKLAGEGKTDLGIAELKEAVRIFPKYFEAHLMIGNLLIQAGRLEEAIPPLDSAREVNPKDDRVYQSFGFLLLKQRKYPVAVAIFAEAGRLNPTNPLNPLMRASALIYQASFVEPENIVQRNDLPRQAELAISQAADLSDKKVKPDAMTLAVFYELKGEPTRAADELEDYLKKNPAAKNLEAIKNEVSRLRQKAAR